MGLAWPGGREGARGVEKGAVGDYSSLQDLGGHSSKEFFFMREN
jgi:hypothetical protein